MFWREKSWPIFHVQHCSDNPQSPLAQNNPGNAFQKIVAPIAGEPIIKKNVNSAFISTTLKQQLDALNIRQLVIAGLTTDHCVSTTTRMAGNYGYEVFIVADATATFDRVGPDNQHYSAEILHATTLASLHKEFATVLNTSEIIAMSVMGK